jgi:isopenicillin N synthase-like dioxygenase
VWGWSSAILSGDRIQAAQHRVQATEPGSRRQTAVLFVAPDLDTVLIPRSGSAAGFNDALANGQVGAHFSCGVDSHNHVRYLGHCGTIQKYFWKTMAQT